MRLSIDGKPWRNGVEKPDKGTTAHKVWSAADAFLRKHRRLPRNEDLASEELSGDMVANHMIKWREFYGFPGKRQPPSGVKRNIKNDDVYMPRGS